jgi:hypothetical protein
MDRVFEEERLLTYSSAHLALYIFRSPQDPSSPRVFYLSAGHVAKKFYSKQVEDELRAMDMARQLGIRVPRIKRIIRVEDSTYVIMERIQGLTLEESWVEIGWIRTIRLAFQLRQVVQCLRFRTSLTAGSPVSGKCRSFWLGEGYGLHRHATPEAIASFIGFWLSYSPRRQYGSFPLVVARRGGKAQASLPKVATSLVFSHHDLAPRNLLVDDRPRLWVLDWEYAGWYPIYFEYASMQNFTIPEEWGRMARTRWKVFSWLSVGLFDREKDVLDRVTVGLG